MKITVRKMDIFAMEDKKFRMVDEDFNGLQIKILEHGLFYGDPKWNHKDVVSPFNRLYFIIKGEGCVENKEFHHNLIPGNVYLIPAGTKYNYIGKSAFIKLYFHFELQRLPGIDVFQSLGRAMSMSYAVEKTEELITLLENGTLGDQLFFKGAMNQILGRFYLKMKDEGVAQMDLSGYYRQKESLYYIEKNLSAQLKIENMAKEMHVSYYSLSRNFKRDTGIGIKEYLEDMLLKKAKHLLLTTDLQLQEIANELQFCDPFYFSRFFRKYEKVSPREYRKMRLNG
ncbi:AraC family transcriptional regulator [uncultured Robinsoniella sp.]|uniref:AraC family transcriptional regulator n=1 Tax=uncultured Robinsoniella sp. TaxID=904190 RepID=UPI00374F06EA